MKNIFLFSVLLILGVLSQTALAQTDPTNPQIICEGSVKAYQVDYTENAGAGTAGSTYAWSVITAGFLGTISTNQGPAGSSNRISIDWGTTAPGLYTIQVIETNGSCPGTPVTLGVQITPKVTLVFNPIGPLCQNTTPPALPAADNNGVTGTWSPSAISTASTGTTTYTFTPDAGQCAIATTMDITIDVGITPTFAAIGPLCQNATAPALPAADQGGITGTWSPSTISTASTGTTTYTFTPDAGQCAVATTLDITIDVGITPVFGAIGPFCVNSVTPALPAADNGGITGTWSPNFISSAMPGTTTYTFTPDPGQCATTTTVDILINDLPLIVADPDAPICFGQNIVINASGGVSYTWSPTTDLSSGTGSPVTATPSITTTYIVTGTDANGCRNTDDITITVNPLPNTSPIFHD